LAGMSDRSFLDVIDVFQRPHTKKETVSCLGGACSFLAVALWLIYTIASALAFAQLPLVVESHVEWYSGHAFPLKIHCLAPSGCLVSNYFSKASGTCLAIVNQTGSLCTLINFNEETSFMACWSSVPSEGLTVFYADANNTLNSFGFSINSEMLSPTGGVMGMLTSIHQGTVLLSYVQTQNGTVNQNSPAALRHEWFPTLLSASVLDPEISSCSSVNSTFATAPIYTRLVPLPSYTLIKVYSQQQWLTFFGQIGGIWRLIVTVLSIFVLGYVIVIRPRLFPNAGTSTRDLNSQRNSTSNIQLDKLEQN